MLNNKHLPLFVVASIIKKNKTVFHKINEKVTIKVPGKLIESLIKLCNGVRSSDEIVQLLNQEWDENSLRGLIEELFERGVLVDSRYLGDSLLKAIENPSCFSSSLTDEDLAKLTEKSIATHKSDPKSKVFETSPFFLKRLIDNRRSTRSFSHKPINFQNIINIIWAAYGELSNSKGGISDHHRSVPSGGALYPLKVNLVLLKDFEEISCGIYDVWLGLPEKVGFNLVSKDIGQFVRSFTDPSILEDAQGVIIVSGSYHNNGKKYGNRSLPYTLLEAGHVAQNIYLTASELEIG
ncbi:MAG: hypothetical protein COU27_01090, partial [Candidatus Levybacteria bacterium CG10_big_fil_rev_8_21_14_0_10_36_7]